MENNSASVFLNGKAQIIEMLQHMPREERVKLLKNIKIRNPQLAEELTQHSYTFSDISLLSDQELKMIFGFVTAPIVGMALKDVERSLQRRLLSLADRNYAEEAYRVMTTSFPTEKRDSKRAQNKIIEILSKIKKSR
ncbi:MAG: hypothetical protein L6Q33_05940 [Bacteriovoracaceae bacterium]|jgi:flagellar motor switch protein FliG|nr:hypothetical protein [Bacteriovoracaceae bacterium]